MPYFYNTNSGDIIIANYKVMNSTVRKQTNWFVLSNWKIALIIVLSKFSFKKKKYFLVRNPYDRLVSFYENKFKRNPTELLAGDSSKDWQYCQKIFFHKLGISSKHTLEEKCKIFTNTSFENFIEMLPDLYMTDLHLIPQYKILKLFFWRVKYDRLIKIEDMDEEFMKSIEVDIMVRVNKTVRTKWQDYYSVSTKSRVKDLYNRDFEIFKY